VLEAVGQVELVQVTCGRCLLRQVNVILTNRRKLLVELL
jgi:hypothetical protein